MSDWAPKRFWSEVSVVPEAGGFAVRLDQRPVRTPAKALLVLPTPGFAGQVADEWRAQGERVDPATMPFTRAANAAIDKVTPQREEVAAGLAAYAETDLLCYRAEGPGGLVARQAEAWDPLLDWNAKCFDAPLAVTGGIAPVKQPHDSLARLRAEVDGMTPFELTGFHDLVALSGSLVIALAAIHGIRPAELLWETSRIDELWQIEQWGEDDEASRLAATKRADFLRALEIFRLSRPD